MAVGLGGLSAGCGAGGGAMMEPAPPTPAVGAEAPPSASGTWELVREGQPTLVLVVAGDRMLLGEAGAAAPSELTRSADGATWEGGASGPGGVTADGATAAASCVEVVAVEPEALVVRVGVMTDGRCVLTDAVLRFARQVQR